MTLSKLVDFIGNENIAEDLDDDQLKKIGARVSATFHRDQDSMDDWSEYVDAGQQLIIQELKPKSHPWENAANFKSPMLMEACIAFGDRASLELLRHRDLAKADVIGRDNDGTKEERAERVSEYLNYQLNHEMTGWRDDQRNLYYQLPLVGEMFKKTVYDPLKGRNVSSVIHYPNFAINQATTNLQESPFTVIHAFSKSDVFERIAAGIWLDVDLYPSGSSDSTEQSGDVGSNEANEALDAEENEDKFLEQDCFFDLDDDGYEEPYTITVQEKSNQVVRIVARYDSGSIIVRGSNQKLVSLEKFLDPQNEVYDGLDRPADERDYDLSDAKMVRIEALDPITPYGFIPNPDGTYLSLGYFHLLGAIVQAINSTTNQLVDAGTLNNLGGGFLAKGFRKKMGPMRQKIGQWTSTEVPAMQLQQGMLPLPAKEPSQTLFALNEKLEATGMRMIAGITAENIVQANTAPTTALAIIQEQLVSTSAIMMSIISSQSKEFQKIFHLNRRYLDPVVYQAVLDDEDADFASDFDAMMMDIVPTADPEQSSRMQRIQLSTVEMSVLPQVLQMGGNPIPIVRNFFERIGSTNVDEIFPDEAAMAPEEKAQLQAIRQAQEQANKLQQLQIDILTREQDRLDMDTRRKVEETIAKISQIQAEIILTLEKAETEDQQNEISKYTNKVDGLLKILGVVIEEDDARRTRSRDEIQARITTDPRRGLGAVAQLSSNQATAGGVGNTGL